MTTDESNDQVGMIPIVILVIICVVILVWAAGVHGTVDNKPISSYSCQEIKKSLINDSYPLVKTTYLNNIRTNITKYHDPDALYIYYNLECLKWNVPGGIGYE